MKIHSLRDCVSAGAGPGRGDVSGCGGWTIGSTSSLPWTWPSPGKTTSGVWMSASDALDLLVRETLALPGVSGLRWLGTWKRPGRQRGTGTTYDLGPAPESLMEDAVAQSPRSPDPAVRGRRPRINVARAGRDHLAPPVEGGDCTPVGHQEARGWHQLRHLKVVTSVTFFRMGRPRAPVTVLRRSF